MWQLLIPFAKDLIERLVASPAEKLEAQKALAELELRAREFEAKTEAAREDAFARLMESTQPKSDRVYVWANTLIALVRPTLAVFAVISPIIWIEQWKTFLNALEGAGIWGAIALVPVWAWVLGRDGVRMILGIVAGRRGKGDVDVDALREALPPGLPPAPKRRAPEEPNPEEQPIRGFEMPEPDEGPRIPERTTEFEFEPR